MIRANAAMLAARAMTETNLRHHRPRGPDTARSAGLKLPIRMMTAFPLFRHLRCAGPAWVRRGKQHASSQNRASANHYKLWGSVGSWLILVVRVRACNGSVASVRYPDPQEEGLLRRISGGLWFFIAVLPTIFFSRLPPMLHCYPA